jgi:hypothetical protein
MRKATRYARTSALPAIAAALALSSTHAFAQEAQPTTPPASEPAPTVSAQPAPAIETAPVTPDTTTVTPDSSAPAPVKPKRTATTVKRATPVATHTVAQKVTTRTTHAAVPAAVAPVAVAAKPAAPASTTVTERQVTMTPIVDTTPRPATAPAQTAGKPTHRGNNTALELGGGALALLALGAGAYALSRRRREDEEVYEDTYQPETTVVTEPAAEPHHDPIAREEPAMIAPEVSAFAWGNQQPATQDTEDDSDRRPGESWVERAYRGPSPANPSVSLRARLKRAAFFDKREREVEAGKAEPVEADAGLPDAMVEEQAAERELA